jgi:hypothetical protein
VLNDITVVRAAFAGIGKLQVIHENGVVVRSAPDLNAPPATPHTIMPIRRVFQVSLMSYALASSHTWFLTAV